MTRTGSGRILAAIITIFALLRRRRWLRRGWKTSYEAGLKAMKAGDFDRAGELMKQAVAAAEKLGKETAETSRALTGLSEVYLAQEKFTEAGLLLERALYILAKAPGSNGADLSRVYLDLSQVKANQDRLGEAEVLVRQVLAYKEKTLGPDHPEVADVLDRLAGLCFFQKGNETNDLEQRALDIRVKAAANSPAKLVDALLKRAEFETWHNSRAGTEPILRKALAVQEKLLGPNHPDVATTLMKIATTRMELGKNGRFGVFVGDLSRGGLDLTNDQLQSKIAALFREYEPLVKRALAIREKALGAGHPDTLQAIDYLAAGYEALGDMTRAEAYLKRLPPGHREKEAVERDHGGLFP